MAGKSRAGARWIALLLGVALVASAVVVYALIRLTSPTGGDQDAVSSTIATVPASTAVPSASITGSAGPSSTGPSALSVTGTASATASAQSTGTDSGTDASGLSQPAGSSAPPSSSGGEPTATSQLAGSGVMLPASWSGEAKVTVTVLGQCAAGSSSGYTTPADLALDLPQNEANAVAPTATSAFPSGVPTLTLGVNATGVPSLSVYSSSVDESGAFHRYWSLQLTPDGDRTLIHGTLINEAVDGANPNIMVDAETSLQPCESSGTVGLPRPLSAGSTISGWVDPTNAQLTLDARTTDGQRSVTVEVTATRKQ